MKPRSPSTSIRQLLALAYLVTAIPAIAFVLFAVRAIDYRIVEAQISFVDGDRFADAITPRSTLFIGIGKMLRERNAPLSISPKVNVNSEQNLGVAINLSDVRTAVIYIWGLILMLGALVIWWLGTKLNGPLDELTNSIEALARDDLETEIVIHGAKDFKVMGKELDALRLRLQRSDQQKNQFLRHISHEIKTPLTSIREGSTLLKDDLLGSTNSEQREVVDILVKSSLELQSAIENLLDYSSAVSDNTTTLRQYTELQDLIRTAIEKHVLQLKQKRLELTLNLEPINFWVDPAQMLAVFENLVSNAVKHSPIGGNIELTLTLLTTGHVEFCIKDDGPGINPTQTEKIFDAFFVGDQKIPTTLKGTGLGLSIAKQYVEAHDGIIESVDTRKGSIFRVTLKPTENTNGQASELT